MKSPIHRRLTFGEIFLYSENSCDIYCSIDSKYVRVIIVDHYSQYSLNYDPNATRYTSFVDAQKINKTIQKYLLLL